MHANEVTGLMRQRRFSRDARCCVVSASLQANRNSHPAATKRIGKSHAVWASMRVKYLEINLDSPFSLSSQFTVRDHLHMPVGGRK